MVTQSSTKRALKVAVLISGRGSNLQALIDHFGPVITSSPVRIVTVISNRPAVQGIERAKKAGIPTAVIDHKAFPDRIAFDASLDRAIREAGAELVVLAGFMRLLTEGFVAAWRNRLINIHPALLPSFRGLDTHKRALKRGVKLHGLATWRDVLDVATESGRLDAKAHASVVEFLEDPEAWSLAHGGKAVAS
jgi:phosphoribosylglycinamide formyltransferase-1